MYAFDGIMNSFIISTAYEICHVWRLLFVLVYGRIDLCRCYVLLIYTSIGNSLGLGLQGHILGGFSRPAVSAIFYDDDLWYLGGAEHLGHVCLFYVGHFNYIRNPLDILFSFRLLNIR